MHVETRLIIIHIDYNSGNTKCLIENDEVPSQIIDGAHPIDSCPNILTDFLEIEPVWVNFILVDVNYENEKLVIYYTCVIPAIVKNLNGDWLDIGSTNENLQETIFKATQKIFAENFGR